MGRFSAVKMNMALDIAFERKYNKLVDLLDTGYSVESIVYGVPIRVSISPQDGLALFQKEGSEWVYRGGLQVINNNAAIITDIIKSPNNDHTFIKFEADRIYKLTERYAGLTNFYATDDNFTSGIPCLHYSLAGYILTDGSATEFNFLDRSGGKVYYNTFVGDYTTDDGGIFIDTLGGDEYQNHFNVNVVFNQSEFMAFGLNRQGGNPGLRYSIDGDDIIEATNSIFEYKGNTVWHSGNLAALASALGI